MDAITVISIGGGLVIAAATVILWFCSDEGVKLGGTVAFIVLAVFIYGWIEGAVVQDSSRDSDLVNRGVLEWRHDGPTDGELKLYWTVPRKESR